MGTRVVDPKTGAKVCIRCLAAGRRSRRVSPACSTPPPLAPDSAIDNVPLFYPRVTSAEAARARTIPGFGSIIYEFYGHDPGLREHHL
jgi:hypothetical protein